MYYISYPRENYFTVLVVIGKKEKEKVENSLSEFSYEIQWLYHRWTKKKEHRILWKEGNKQH